MTTTEPRFVCRCRVCPACGVDPGDDYQHPEDGLADCPRCGREWWAGVGPIMDGTHPKDANQAVEWDAYDSRVMRGEAP